MNIAQAKLVGVKAFESGKARAPALNGQFIKAACGQQETEVASLLAAYVNGWTIANLVVGAIPGSPSIRSYAAIVNDPAAV